MILSPARALLALLAAAAAAGADTLFELRGVLAPPIRASVSLHGATTPFAKELLTGPDGRFRVRGLPPGPYTVSAFAPGQGEVRRTVEVGPGTSNAARQVEISLSFEQASLTSATSGHTVSTRELQVSAAARREYQKAQKRLSLRDVPRAVEHLERAVAFSPGFSAAWNNLGTIAYQTGQYQRAESHFRQALLHEPSSFAPLVNLGGVLLTLNKLDEAWKYNLYAVLSRPRDALANSQLGMTYFALSNFPPAIKYLQEARRIDPAHFSYPQLTLAEIYSRLGDTAAAKAQLEEFLRYHPDVPLAARVRELLSRLPAAAAPAPSANDAGVTVLKDVQ